MKAMTTAAMVKLLASLAKEFGKQQLNEEWLDQMSDKLNDASCDIGTRVLDAHGGLLCNAKVEVLEARCARFVTLCKLEKEIEAWDLKVEAALARLDRIRKVRSRKAVGR